MDPEGISQSLDGFSVHKVLNGCGKYPELM
jgi:hypothetical protein